MTRVVKNIGYQTIYQVLTMCLPLITTPYISRVIGVEGLGIYSYTYSNVNYYVVIAMLGTLNYGTKTIALTQHNKDKRTKKFWEIYALQIFTSLIALVGYLLGISTVIGSKSVLVAQTIWIIACFFDINWYFFGVEKFKITAIRSIIVKLLTIGSIFLFIKTPEDLLKYVIVMALGTLISQMCLWPVLLKEIAIYKPTFQGVIQHIIPNIVLFIPLLAVNVYHLMDKTMLGMFSTDKQSGIYYSADKMMNIPLALITAVAAVMLPHMTSLVGKGKVVELERILYQSLEILMFMTYALSFGIAAVAKEFVPIFFGSGYEECIGITCIFSIVMIVKSLSSILRNQYLIPNNKEKIYTLSVVTGVVVNLVSNYWFIVCKNRGAMGATLGTLITEFVTCVLCIIFIQHYLNIIHHVFSTFIYIIPGILMFVVVRVSSKICEELYFGVILEVFIGAFVYLLFCLPIIKRRKIISSIRDLSREGIER